MASSNLGAIRTKVRRLTRSPSVTQLTNDEIDEYVNTFVLYDIPEQLRLFNYRTTFTFYTSPYIDTYQTNQTDPTDQFYNFKNKYITVHPPVYVAGYQTKLSQDENEFYAWYPFANSISQIATGDGATVTFTGTLQDNGLIPMIQRKVTFTSIDANNEGLVVHDVPVVDANGNPTNVGNLYVPGSEPAIPPTVIDANNTVNYVTGTYTLTFNGAPASDAVINVQNVPYVAARPFAILYFNDAFIVRPIPDQVYAVQCEVYIRPTELIEFAQSPDLEGMWQYIAYGAAKKIFEDRSDMDSVQTIIPEFKQQERFVLRRTLVQLSNDSTATIYRSQLQFPGNWWGWNQFT